jgi:hypothetical protein
LDLDLRPPGDHQNKRLRRGLGEDCVKTLQECLEYRDRLLHAGYTIAGFGEVRPANGDAGDLGGWGRIGDDTETLAAVIFVPLGGGTWQVLLAGSRTPAAVKAP